MLVGTKRYFSISQVVVHKPENLQSIVGIKGFVGRFLLTIDEKKEAKNLAQNNPLLSKVILKKMYPHTLDITVSTSESIAQLEVNGGYFLLSENARVLGKTKELDLGLTRIHFFQQFEYRAYQTGDVLDYIDLKAGLIFLKKTLALGLPIDTIDINGENVLAFSLKGDEEKPTKRTIFMSTDKEIDRQVYELNTIISKFKIEGRDFKTLDLRFSRPVIVF